MRFVEATGAAWTAEQLRAAEAELEMQKREWEANRLAAMQKEEQLLKQETESEELLTYSRKDASNQVNTKQDSNLSKRTSIVGVGGIRLTKQNKRDKRFKHQGSSRGGLGLSRSVSNQKSRSNVQQVSPVRTRRNSLNVSAPTRSSCNSNNSSKKPVTGTALARRQTRLHSVGEDNVIVRPTVTTTATPPTRKTTRTAMAAAGGTSTPISEERPKRLSANIAMTKLMKTILKPPATSATTPAKNSTQVAKPKRRESASLTISAANRRKLLERRATISSPLALKGNDSEDEEDNNEKDDGDDAEDAEADSEEENASVQVDDDEDKDEEDEAETAVSGSASVSAQEDTTQTEDEELHVEVISEEEEEEDEGLNVETQSSSSYATAGEGGDSLDGWNAHNQVQDTTMTSSTYYNVSEESDTDEPNDPLSMSKAENKTETKESTPALQRQRSNSSRGGSDEPIGHTPRTRSRGSVKINLWTLDVSPVANVQKGSGGAAGKSMKRTTPLVETKLKGRQRQQAGAKRRLVKKVNEGQTTTLNRWITQTPRVRLRSSNAGTAMPTNSSSNAGAASSSTGAAVASKAGANGASSNR